VWWRLSILPTLPRDERSSEPACVRLALRPISAASGSFAQRRRTASRPHLAHRSHEWFLLALRHDRRMDDRGGNQPDASGSMRQLWGTLIEINRRARYDFLSVE
jgi:hypothetical protein